MRRQGWEQTVFGPRFIKFLPKEVRQKFVDLLNQCEEQVAWPLAGIHHTGVFACQRGERRATYLFADNALPHMESYEKSLRDGVVRCEGGFLGRCSERQLAAASGFATIGG